MRYIDANVFVHAAIDVGPTGNAARLALRRALREKACTSALTVDEVLWVVKKLQGRKQAAETVRRLLRLDLEVHPVDRRDVDAALLHFDRGLDPRDAIHAAVALRWGCTAILSTDDDFASVTGLTLETLH